MRQTRDCNKGATAESKQQVRGHVVEMVTENEGRCLSPQDGRLNGKGLRNRL